jgi:transcriptional regulator with XRE-family HTH domain
VGKLADSITDVVGKNIRTLRMLQNISQNQLAYEAGLTREFINKVESGKCNISIKKLASICEALNISPKKLFESIK